MTNQSAEASNANRGTGFSLLIELGLRRSGQGVRAELADPAVRADDEGKREGVPVLVGVGGVLRVGVRGRQLGPSSVEMSVPLGPTVIQVLVVES